VRVAFPDRMPGFGESLTHRRVLQEDPRLDRALEGGVSFSQRSVKTSGRVPQVCAVSRPQGLDPTAAHTRASLANQLRRWSLALLERCREACGTDFDPTALTRAEA